MPKKQTKNQQLAQLASHFAKLGFPEPITLSSILAVLIEKYGLTELSERELWIIGAWKYRKNDLRKQFTKQIALVHYLILTPLPNGTSKVTKKIKEGGQG